MSPLCNSVLAVLITSLMKGLCVGRFRIGCAGFQLNEVPQEVYKQTLETNTHSEIKLTLDRKS